jgi:maltooligosyltrehalose trehalohydrolase
LAEALLLLSPQIPMLFMGEDWAATAPFLFFVDFASDAELSRAVRKGRRREFARFAAFAGEAADRIPDPTDEATFAGAKLDWGEAAAPEHASVRAMVKHLLALRRQEVLPLIVTSFHGAVCTCPTADSLDVIWRFAAGTLRLCMNVGNVTVEHRLAGERAIWASAEAEVADGAVLLPPWTGIVLRGPA